MTTTAEEKAPPNKSSNTNGAETKDVLIDIDIDNAAGTSSTGAAPPDRTPAMADYIRVFSYATKWDFLVYALAAFASIGAGVTMPLMNVIFGQLVGQFTGYFAEDGSDIMSQGEFQSILNRQALYIMALFIGRWGLNAINKFCFRMIGIRLSSAVRLHYLQALFAQAIHTIDSMPPGAAATAITSTSNTLQIGISERLGTFLQFTGTIVCALVVAFTWSWSLTLVTSSLVFYVIVVGIIVLPPIVKSQSDIEESDAQATAIASEALAGVRQVMAAGAQKHVRARYESWVAETLKRAHRIAPVIGLQLGLVFFGVFGSFGLAFWYGTQRYAVGAIKDAGVVIVVLMSVMMILTSLERISTPLIAVSKAMVAACEFFTVIDAPLPPSGDLKPDLSGQDIIFEDALFEYPSRPGTIILDSLNLRIPFGKNTAIVGPSGSGKSTVVALLERWYSLRHQAILPRVIQSDPKKAEQEKKDKADKKKQDKKSKKDQKKKSEEEGATPAYDEEKPKEPAKARLSGAVKIGDYNLEDLDLKYWRAHIGLVQQEPFLFNNTIYGNVANGLIGTQWENETEERKREMVAEACQESYAHDFITRLPDGYNTRVGDGGTKLSGGQKQRIALARSIIKKPSIMILDEATSALDARGERIVQAALDRVSRGRTTITIAHRLSTIKKADNIVVLQAGRAIEQGTHESLLTDEAGVYSQLVKAQTLRMAGDRNELLSVDLHDQHGGSATEVSDTESALPIHSDHDEPVISTKDDVVPSAIATAGAEPGSPSDTSSGPKQRSLLRSFGVLLWRQRSRWPSFAATLLASMCVAAGTPLQAWLFAKAINVFLQPDISNLKSDSNFWGLMWFALAGGVGIAYMTIGWLTLHAQYLISATYKRQYFRDMLDQKVAFFDDDSNSHGSLSARVSGDAKQLEELLGVNLAFLLSGIWTVLGCVIIALVFGWKLGIVALLVTMPILLGSGYWKYRHEVQFDQMNSAVFAESSQFATEAVGAIRTVCALTMETAIDTRYAELLRQHVQAAFRKALWTAGLFGFAESASLGCQALVFWYGGKLLASREYNVEAFFVCFMAIIQGAENASQVLAVAPSAAQAKAAANRILDVHELADAQRAATTMGQGAADEQVVEKKTEGGVRVELKDVSFKYPTRDIQVLDNLSLTIEKGQYAALVGPSGCGKTTIISLLERFYTLQDDKCSGAILLDGTDISTLPLEAYRRGLSLVAQEPAMFRGTIRDNVLFGMADPSSVPDEQLHQVCRDAFIHDFISSLPEGYDTDMGFRGLTLSGGQKQRIALARALVREPRLLLLDEATSALDSESEKVVLRALEGARRGRTVVAVAHRLATIQDADVIFVFDEGRVVERGRHEELVGRRGVYWGMCQAQALDQ